ncbi:M4 family metallopeptidase [Telluria aromaticivorans]|uniref:Neutral metalloproteinase n=1 Tax=Telluria aromaticivorans TaxID=2725995 RepID=A0A7Y2JZT7_9BURK|nr:M4 family metallopeptidase [Telluria aromaticivorans]NNG23463.1 M4 family metallopeptidase [Telluria aromaticivorans]
MTPHTTFPAALLGAALLLAHLPLAAAPTMSPPTTLSAKAEASVLGQLAGRRQAKGLDPDHHYKLTAQHPGANGTQVLRAAHTYKGLRVFGSESVVVLDKSAKILSESASERRLHLGKGSSNRLGALTASFSVQPQISTKAAIEAALATQVAGTVHLVPPRAELLIYPVMRMQRVVGAGAKEEAELNALDVEDAVERYELAYLVSTRMRLNEQPVYFDTVISARDAAVLDQWNMLQTVLGTGKSQYNGEVPISTTLAKGSYQMLDPERGTGGTFGAMAITNANNGSSAGKVYTNATNIWGDGKQFVEGSSTTGVNGQTAAVNAMWGLMNTYDAHKNVLGWLSLDGRDTSTYIAAHVNRGYDNAYYSDTCRCMFIGDGTYFTSLGSIDVIGHEMGHGITAATSSLVYSGESGGLNESSSDITGEIVEAYARAGGKGDSFPEDGNDWQLGTEISRNATPLRWMYRPSKDGSSPDAWSSSLRRLDVHYSSGPNNRMFYFLAKGSRADSAGDYYSKYLVKQPQAMTGIGTDKAFRIWFHANTTKFTSSTNYADARAKMIEAASELYGKDSKEAVAVQRAYAAINVGADVEEPAPPPGT